MDKEPLALPPDWKNLLRPNTLDGTNTSPIGSVTHYQCGDKNLYFIVADHKAFPDNQACAVIPEAFKQLDPKAVVIETKANHDFAPAAKYHAQTGFQQVDEVLYTAYQAQRKNIPVIGGEPPDKTINASLSHKAKDLTAFYLLRQIGFMADRNLLDTNRLARRDDTYLNEIARQNRLPTQPSFTFAESEAWQIANIGKDKIAELTNNDFAPLPHGTHAQKLSHEIGLIREQNILTTIVNAVNAHQTVLVVYGSGHLTKSQNVLEKIFGAPGQPYALAPSTPPARNAPSRSAALHLTQ